jgi:hypothetical protein
MGSSTKSGGRNTWNSSWYHIAVSYNFSSGLLKTYVNGTLEWLDDTYFDKHRYSFWDIRIGTSWWGDPDELGSKERIDEVRYWNVCRSSVEINDAYDRILNDAELNSPELIGYWRFDDGDGISPHDYSLQHNNALFGAEPSNPEWCTSCAPAIPEFPSALTLSLFMIFTLVAVVFSKKKRWYTSKPF